MARPIFIVGVGRSGSTVFHRILSEHPSVAWLSSGLASLSVDRPSLNRVLMQVIDIPLLGRLVGRRFLPGECYMFWEHHCKGFSHPCRDLRAADVTLRAKREVLNAMTAALTPKRHRLLLKITGWPRIGYLSEIFGDARFVHILRDGRAVANSLLNTDWWWGWRGPENWRLGTLAPAQNEEWKAYDRSFVALAGMQWKILMDAMETARQSLDPKDFLAVRYEDLCSNPVNVLKNTIEFCELAWTDEFEQSVSGYQLRNANYKWQEDLASPQQEILEGVLAGHLARYGYL